VDTTAVGWKADAGAVDVDDAITTSLTSFGITFQVYNETGCNITSLDIRTPLTTYMVVEVYSKQQRRGSSSSSSFADDTTNNANINYYNYDNYCYNNNAYNSDTDSDTSDNAWTLTSKVAVKGLGINTATPLPAAQFETLFLTPNSTVSFFITTTQEKVASIVTNDEVGTTVVTVEQDGAEMTSTSSTSSQDSTMTLQILVRQTVMDYPVHHVLGNSDSGASSLSSQDEGSRFRTRGMRISTRRTPFHFALGNI
jgi:hypothetical protein